jgi:hypothetical protein
MKYQKVVEDLQNVQSRVRKLEKKMCRVDHFMLGVRGQAPSVVFLSVSEGKTLEVLKTFKIPATAEDVAKVAGRARAIESMHLNQLFRRNMVLKGRSGRKNYFLLRGEYRDQGQTVGS